MNSQINLRLSDSMLKKAKTYSKRNGYGSVQELIKETLRERLFGEELTPKELDLVKRLIKVTDKKKLWVSEDKLWKSLEPKAKQ